MITSKQINPPAQFKPDGIGEPVIGVRILIQSELEVLSYYPAQNRIGTDMLCSLLVSRMEQAGVRVGEVLRGLEFNQSFYTFEVSEITPAQESIKDELGKLVLLDSAQIAWYDSRECVWRVFHSKSGWFEAPSGRELDDYAKFLAELRSVLKRGQRSKDEPADQ